MILKRYIDFPTELEEFTPKQALKWIELLLKFESGEINHHDLKTELATYLVRRKFNKKEAQEAFIATQIFRLTEHLDYLFEEKEREDKIELHPATTIKNLLPRIKWLYGPSEALQDLSFIEYIHAYQYYREFLVNQDESKLNELAAVLYRRKQFFVFGKRVKYNADKTERRSKRFSEMHPKYKYAAFYFFKGCDNYLREAILNIGGNEIDLSILFSSVEGDSKDEGDGLGMLGVLFKLAETGVFGNVKETSEQNFWDIMLNLYKNRKDFLNAKRKNK